MSPHRPITPSPPHADPGPSMQMRYAAETYLTDIPRQIETRCYVLDSAIGERSELREAVLNCGGFEEGRKDKLKLNLAEDSLASAHRALEVAWAWEERLRLPTEQET